MNYFTFILLSCLLSVVAVRPASGQAALLVLIFGNKIASEKFHLSIDAGLNYTAMPGYGEGKARFGINFGLGTHYKLSERWFLAPEFKPLNWKGLRDVQESFTLPPVISGDRVSSRFRMNYIDVPLLVQYRFPSNFYVSAGPQVSFLTSAKQLTKVKLDDGLVIDVTQDIRDAFKSVDISFPFEVGYAFKNTFAGRGFDIRLRYAFSLANVLSDADDPRTVRHSNLQFILTLPFVVTEEQKD